MDAMDRMDRSVGTVVHDLELVLERVRQLRKDVRLLDRDRPGDVRLEAMMEMLADTQARVEGIEAFVQACRNRAHRDELPMADFDLWM